MARKKVDQWLWQVGVDLQRLNEEMASSRPAVATGRYWEPRVDVIDLGDRLLVRAEIAGVRVDEVGLMYNLDRHSLLIRGNRREELEDEYRAAFHQLEIPFGEFQREVKLPGEAIDPEGIRAHYRNGFLYVILPKRERIFVSTLTISEI
jgi:HSP20 family protein